MSALLVCCDLKMLSIICPTITSTEQRARTAWYSDAPSFLSPATAVAAVAVGSSGSS